MIIEKVVAEVVSYMQQNNKCPNRLIISTEDLLKLKEERPDIDELCYGLKIELAFNGMPLHVIGD